MKIEKLDENSISIFINKEELKVRDISINSLSYGTKKAKNLIVEMIKLADSEVGFKADAPLAVEAVPLKEGDVKLIITKVISPDELDARFSKFTPTNNKSIPINIMQMLESTIDKFEEALRIEQVKGVDEVNTVDTLEIRKEEELVCIFEFENIDKASDACKNIKNFDYISVLYKDEKNIKFYLVLSINGFGNKEKISDFNKACNTLAEYGTRQQGGLSMNQAYYEEHYKIVIKEDAVKKLSML